MESGPPGPELHVTPAVVSIYQSHDSDHDFLLNISFQLTLQMVTVWISSAIRDLLFIQQNKFYWISNRSGVAELIQTVYLSNSHFMSQDPPPCFWGVTPPRVIQTTVQATWVAGGPFTKNAPKCALLINSSNLANNLLNYVDCPNKKWFLFIFI